jgi:hypothetical protein
MKKLLIIVMVWSCCISMVSSRAATFSFDGSIERNPESYYDWHTLDFIFLQVLSPSTLMVTGTGGTLLDFNFGLYVPGSIIEGRQRLTLASNLTYVSVSDTAFQIQCSAAPGSYIVAVDPSASDWDSGDGVVPYFSSDGGLEFAQGTYHLEITGDFLITKIQEGKLPSAVPEPSSLVLGLAGFFCVWHRIGRRRSSSPARQQPWPSQFTRSEGRVAALGSCAQTP